MIQTYIEILKVLEIVNALEIAEVFQIVEVFDSQVLPEVTAFASPIFFWACCTAKKKFDINT